MRRGALHAAEHRVGGEQRDTHDEQGTCHRTARGAFARTDGRALAPHAASAASEAHPHAYASGWAPEAYALAATPCTPPATSRATPRMRYLFMERARARNRSAPAHSAARHAGPMSAETISTTRIGFIPVPSYSRMHGASPPCGRARAAPSVRRLPRTVCPPPAPLLANRHKLT